MNASEQGPDLGMRPSDQPADPVEGRSDGELWKRHRPTGEAPARSGGDEDVDGAVPPADMEAYKEELHNRPAPGLLDTDLSKAEAERHAEDEKEVRDILDPMGEDEEGLHQQHRERAFLPERPGKR